MIMVFAGTSTARTVVNELLSAGEKVLVSTATEYGGSLYAPHKRLTILSGPLTTPEMIETVKTHGVTKIIDATHPYATEVTANIKACAKALNISYLCMGRDSFFKDENDDNVIYFNSYEQAAEYLSHVDGNILLTIGSRHIEPFACKIAKERLLIRVLPMVSVLQKCESLGLTPKQIIAMQGPFSYRFNDTLYEDYGIRYMVTKDSGKAGGMKEKVEPALNRCIKVLVIRRPKQ